MNTQPSAPQKKPLSRDVSIRKVKEISDRQRIAETLFCSDKFAMVDFRQMDAEDWKLHAQRAWEIAGIFVTESKRHL